MVKKNIILQFCLLLILFGFPVHAGKDNGGYGNEVTPIKSHKRTVREDDKRRYPKAPQKTSENLAITSKLEEFWERIPPNVFVSPLKKKKAKVTSLLCSDDGKLLPAELDKKEIISAKKIVTIVTTQLLEKGFSVAFCTNVFPLIKEEILKYGSRSTLFNSAGNPSTIHLLRDLPPLIHYSLKHILPAISSRMKGDRLAEMENQWLRLMQNTQERQNLKLTAEILDMFSHGLTNSQKVHVITHFAACAEDPMERTNFPIYKTWLEHIRNKFEQNMTFDERIGLLLMMKE